jgi:ABC-type transport system substrate-binding protein
MRRTKWNALAFLFSGALILAACGGQPSASPTDDGDATPAATPTDDGTEPTEEPTGYRDAINIALDGQVRQVSNANTDVPTGRLLGWLYNALYRFDDALEPVPDLTDGVCDVSDDELVYTCTLLDGLTFHNGDPVTADDVVYTYELAMSENCSFNPSICLTDFLDTAVALDELTVEFTLPEAYAPFVTTALSGLGIESQAVIEAAFEDFVGGTEGLTADDIQAVRDPIAEATGAEEPDPAACEAALGDAETILTDAGAELPDRAAYTTDGEFNACGYAGELDTALAAAQRGLQAEGVDAVAAVYRLLSFNKDPVGTGPYRWESFSAGQSVTFSAFEDYHHGAPATQTINFQIITDQVAAASALDAGQIDLAYDLTPDGYAAVQGNDDLKFAEYPGFVHLELQFNVREDRVFGDLNLRRAMAMCFDKPATVDAATDGLGIPMEGPIPPASWAFNPDIPAITEDVEGARALIEESGWTEGADGIYERDGERLEFTSLVREGQSDRVNYMQLFADQVARCGIQMNVQPADFATVLLPALDAAHTPAGFDVYFGGWFSGYEPDPYSLFHCDEVQTEESGPTYNYVGYCNEESDRLIEAGLRTSDQEERQQIYYEWQEILAEDLPYLFAYSNIVRDGMNAGMTYVEGELQLDSPNWGWSPHLLAIEE